MNDDWVPILVLLSIVVIILIFKYYSSSDAISPASTIDWLKEVLSR